MKPHRKVRMGAKPRDYLCPFCGGVFSLPDPDDIEEGAADAVCVHSVPPCPTWLRMGVSAFVRAAADKSAERPS